MNIYEIKEAGAGPLISALCDSVGLTEIINKNVFWDKKQCLIDPGTHVKAMVINILSGRTPLYKIEEFYAEQDVELLFGSGVKAANFNDDALCRTLDKISTAGSKKIFSALALEAIARENIDISVLHGDTTSKLVYGSYEGEGELNITYGHSKDHRPDLKQYICAMVTNKEGIPCLGEVRDGNLDDKTWNKELLENLSKHFNLEELKQLIYVADSAVITKTNLEHIAKSDLRFISRLPNNFNLAAELVGKAWQQNCWQEIGSISKKKNSASYRFQEFNAELYGYKYRFIVVHSSHLDKRKAKSLDKRLEKEKNALTKGASKFMKLTFACEKDAKDALSRFLQDNNNRFYPLYGTVEKILQKKRSKRGRPAKDEPVEYQELYRVRVDIGELDQKLLNQEKERMSCFVLITNIFDSSYSAVDILREHKQQSVVENKFKFIKNPLYVGPLYIQKKDRLEALSYVIFMALLLYSILERRVRRALLDEDEPLVLVGKKSLLGPLVIGFLNFYALLRFCLLENIIR
ncbi:MAG: hypothetical protein PWQ82_134 [Thermosediminibacterales bacterium]|nr:hypothetical protein [Thermosediminibacterales bacterium]MDK2835299.1 hypothetical protein [Thermosediminibacterales bacterium]